MPMGAPCIRSRKKRPSESVASKESTLWGGNGWYGCRRTSTKDGTKYGEAAKAKLKWRSAKKGNK